MKINIKKTLNILSRIDLKKCVKSIEIIKEKIYDDHIEEGHTFFGKYKRTVRDFDGERTIKWDPQQYINYYSNDINQFWETGALHIIEEGNAFKRLAYIKIKLYNLKNYDINKSVKNTYDINIWNDNSSETELVKIFKDLKERIINHDLKIQSGK